LRLRLSICPVCQRGEGPSFSPQAKMKGPASRHYHFCTVVSRRTVRVQSRVSSRRRTLIFAAGENERSGEQALSLLYRSIAPDCSCVYRSFRAEPFRCAKRIGPYGRTTISYTQKKRNRIFHLLLFILTLSLFSY